MLDDSYETTAVDFPGNHSGRPTRKELLTEAEASQFLRVSREAVLRFKRDPVDPIPCYKAGRRFLFDAAEILKWAKRQAQRAYQKNRRR